MTTDPGRDLAAHGAALRGLARALVGGGDADDLLQDGFAAVLQTGRSDVAEPVSWLAGVLRRLAGKRRRRLEVERRSLGTPSARDEATAPSAAEQAAKRELIAKLDAELLTLPEPYRATLIARYFEALPPTAIAVRDRVPVATVKSRLARGLALMRERFDAEPDGRAWRANLVAALGLDRMGTAAPAPVAIAGGVMLMGTWTKAVLPLAVAGAIAWFGWRGTGPEMQIPAATGSDGVAAADRGDLVATQPPRTTAVERAVAAATGAERSEGTVAVCGRCVDEQGAPLPGVAVTVTYRDPWDNGPSLLAEMTTAADGRFAAVFANPPAQAVWVQCVVPTRVTVAELCRHIAAGSTIDLGDLPLAGGCVVRGQILDDRGAPVAGRVTPVEQDKRRVPTPLFDDAEADASGAFLLRLLPGDYRLFVEGEEVLDGERLTVPSGAGTFTTRITVKGGLQCVQGIVVDADGAPVPHATVRGEEMDAGGHYATTADVHGRFVMKRVGDGTPKELVVAAEAPGLEHVRMAQPVAWGTRSLRIVLPRTVSIELRVVHAATGAPIEHFAVRAAVGRPASAGQSLPGRFAGGVLRPQAFERPRDSGRHPDGVLLLSGLRRDVYALRVEPLAPDLAPSAVRLVEVTDDRHQLRIALWPRAVRDLLVVDPDGAPIADCAVELCEAFRGEVTLEGRVADAAQLLHMQVPELAVRLQATHTDAAGQCTLAGPGGHELAVRVLGPGCVPQVLPRIRLDDAGPLRLVVDRGATLRVTATPADVPRQLAALAGSGAENDTSVGLRLRAVDGAATFPPGHSAPTPFDDRGCAILRGTPSGTFDVELEWRVGTTAARARVGRASLTASRETRLDVDLGALRPAVLDGTVSLNGERLADTRVELRGERTHLVATDGRGRFRFAGPPGTYRLVAQPEEGLLQLGAAQKVTLLPGDAAEAHFELHTAPLTLRFVDGRGRPVGGVHEARVLRGPGEWVATFPDSDADGRTARSAVEAGVLLLRVMPRRYAEVAAKQRWLAEHPGQDLGALDLDLGQVVVAFGRDNVATVVLPAAYFE